jgi:hypothetical protein
VGRVESDPGHSDHCRDGWRRGVDENNFAVFVQQDRPPIANAQTTSNYNQLGQFIIGLSGQEPDGFPLAYSIT